MPKYLKNQARYLQTVNQLTINGVIGKEMLFCSPFTNLHQDGVIGLFDDANVTKVIKLIDRVNENALVMQVGRG